MSNIGKSNTLELATIFIKNKGTIGEPMTIVLGIIAVLTIGYIVSHFFGRESPIACLFRVLYTIFRKLWILILLGVILFIVLGF